MNDQFIQSVSIRWDRIVDYVYAMKKMGVNDEKHDTII